MLKIESYLHQEAIILDLQVATKRVALKTIANHLFKHGFVSDAKQYFKALIKREQQFTTGIGNGVAIPHTQANIVTKNVILVARLRAPINWNAFDNKPIDLIFNIALSPKNVNAQVTILEQLAKKMMSQKKMQQLRHCQTKRAIIKAITT